jgi:stage V sporulation protein AE
MALADFGLAFVVGGLICVLAQLTLDLVRNLTAAHVMVLFASLGAVASGFGLYERLIEFAGAGAAIPLTAFGHSLVQGMLKEGAAKGFGGLLAGGLTATAMGLTVAIVLGLVMALIARPKG